MNYEALLQRFCFSPLIYHFQEYISTSRDHFVVANPLQQNEPSFVKGCSHVLVDMHYFFYCGHGFCKVVLIEVSFDSLRSYWVISLIFYIGLQESVFSTRRAVFGTKDVSRILIDSILYFWFASPQQS